MTTAGLWQLLKRSFSQWNAHRAPELGAALAYYSILSMAPLLVLVVGIAGLAFGEKAVRGEIVYQIGGLVGDEGARAVEMVLQSAQKPGSGVLATLIGMITLLFGASGVFGELRDSLNLIWGATPKAGSGIKDAIRARFFSFLMVLSIGFLLLVSLTISAGLAAVGKFVQNALPMPPFALQIFNLLFSFIVITVFFAMTYKYVPDVRLQWRDVWIGAAGTGLLFAIGKLAIGLYLGKAAVGSAYGAAGSLIVLLVWLYYSAQIFLLGAEFTQVYATSYGSLQSREQPDTAIDRRTGSPQNMQAAEIIRR